MVISQLPLVDIPSEEKLSDEDNRIIEAFDVILNGYKRSQSRLQTISKAYKQLESIAQSLLKDANKNVKKTPKKEETVEKTFRKEISPLQLHNNDSRDDILTVDLTYDPEALDVSLDFPARATSPIFGQPRKKTKKNSISDEANLSEDSIQRNKNNEAGPSTKKVANQEENISVNEAVEENEENRPPKSIFINSKCTANDSSQVLNESQTVAKIGFSKTVYNIDQHKTPTGKRSRQATLVFQPQSSKSNVTCTEKNDITKPDFRRKSDFFAENYRNTKRSEKNCEEDKESPDFFAPKSKKKSVNTSFNKSETPKSDKKQIPGKNLAGDNSFMIATPSQIDETARSLFDDEDMEEFDASKDLLNTCLDSPSIVENVRQPVAPKIHEKRDETIVPIASISKAQDTQFFGAMDSIDETFFAPVEIEIPMKIAEKMEKSNLKNVCSTETTDTRDKNRNLKRKPENETQIEAATELGDLEVQDIDWDQDITTHNWPPPKRPLNDSFDFVPQKKKNSPNFANKGKVERNQAERAKLPGWDCKDCEKYYGTMNLPAEEMKKHMNRCSRHRSKFNPRYCTPKNFWNPVFPDVTDSSDFSDDETFEKRIKTTPQKK